MPMRLVVRGRDGKPIKLNRLESAVATHLETENNKLFNSLGFEIPITTLTTVIKKVSQQRYFTLPPDDYVPVRTGEGAWSTSLTTFREYATASSFSSGIVNTANQNDKLASADAGVDAINVPIFNWAKQITYSLFELNYAIKNANWDLVEARQRARLKNWQLGIQELTFQGIPDLSNGTTKCYGLLNQPNIATSNTVITKPISAMTPEELAAFPGRMLEAYRRNCARTVYPNRLIVPEGDWNSFANPTSPTFPIQNRYDYLLKAFRQITKNPNFEILPCAYADVNDEDLLAPVQSTYVLYNYDDEAIRLDIPVDYTATVQNSVNNFQFQNVGYGQFSGVQIYRPAEIMYFVVPPAA